MVTRMSSQWPASDSSIELSTTSNTRWCRPVPSEVSPMYMPGRLRTASRPSRIWMDDAPYAAESADGDCGVLSLGIADMATFKKRLLGYCAKRGGWTLLFRLLAAENKLACTYQC